MFDFTTYANDNCHRAIYTANENLLEDLGLDISQDEINFLTQKMTDSGIDHDGDQKNRCFDYAFDNIDLAWLIPSENLLSPLLKGGASRFSDGSYGVFYAAEDEDTAILETLYHDYKRAYEYFSAMPDVPTWTTYKCLYKCNIASRRSVDLLSHPELNKIIDPNSYEYSQKVGKDVKGDGGQMLRVHSARKEQGICIPVFSQLAVEGVKKHKFLKVVLFNDKGKIHHSVTRSDQVAISFKAGGEPQPTETS